MVYHHLSVQHKCRQKSETYHVSERIKFFAYVGIGMKQSGAQSVAEVAYGSGKHEIERCVKISPESRYHTQNTAKQVHGCDCIRNMSDYIHVKSVCEHQAI